MICMKHGGLMKKIKNKFPYKQVKIIWIDITQAENSWMSIEDAKDHNYSFCEDIGYLLCKDQKKLTIFTSYSFDEQTGKLDVGGVCTYPRKCVLKIIRL